MNQALAIAAVTLLLTAGAPARAQPSSAEQRFRELYRELVETNTTLSAGSCTLAAERMAARLKAAGYSDAELHLFTAPGHPKEGGLIAVYPGRDARGGCRPRGGGGARSPRRDPACPGGPGGGRTPRRPPASRPQIPEDTARSP